MVFIGSMLSSEGALPAWHTPAPEPMPELRTRVFNAPLAEMLDGPLRADLEQNELKEYLAKRRWFSAKDQALTSARFRLDRAAAGTGGRVVMAEVEVGLGWQHGAIQPAAGDHRGSGSGHAAALAARAGPLPARPAGRVSSPMPSPPIRSRMRVARGAARRARRSHRRPTATAQSDGELRFVPTSLLDARSLPRRPGNPPLLGRAVELQPGDRRQRRHQDHPPSRPRHSSRGRNDAVT